ncbi:tRNA preQ1(34) S-adenosylmethionine ribosyltransferase-isomerase QueA [Candidatus Woesearchaeota archaeon]|nr:tRNA preQ1(34) S-adenosylmethionine ribosyltransferase-isomerase QueA [Candidatus Woesearchaeota archaeon]
MKLDDFDYDLPKERIAQKPISPRDSSRLMVINSKVEHKHFFDVVDYFSKGDVLVLNETKVIPAKLVGRKETGARVELIVSEAKGRKCKCRIKGKKPRKGNKLFFRKFKAEIIGVEDDEFVVEFSDDVNLIMKKIGELPTPPYVKRKLDKDSQYQTVYSKKKGSIAAPTAGLHFTKRLLKKIKAKGVKLAKVVLHVDFGTFLPVRDINAKKLHKEYFEVDSKNAKLINSAKRLIVVGTTSVRALESVADKHGKIRAKRGNTELFIKPGYKFKVKYDAMITNFHLPKSTLLMLVSAFIERKKILDAYKIAVSKKYRFFSFGDAMLLQKFK